MSLWVLTWVISISALAGPIYLGAHYRRPAAMSDDLVPWKHHEIDELLVKHAETQHRLTMHGDLRGIYGDFAPFDLETGQPMDLEGISRTITDDDPLCDDWQNCDVCRPKATQWLAAEAEWDTAIAAARHAEYMKTEDGKLEDAGWVRVQDPRRGKWYTNGVIRLQRKDISLDGYYNGEVPNTRRDKRRR